MPQPFLALNTEQTEKALRKYGEQLRDGKLTLSKFEVRAAKEIRDAVTVAFRFASGGPLNPPQLAMLNSLLAEQQHYFDRMVAGLRDGSIALEAAPHRAAAYAGSTTTAQAYGVVTGKPADSRFLWDGPDGEESCEDCGPRIGQTFTLDELMAGGFPGQQTCLTNCRCDVTPVDEERAA